jgi:hypothetical protein
MANRAEPGGSGGTRHSATQVSGPFLKYRAAHGAAPVSRHEVLDAFEIVAVDRLLEPSDLVE